MDTAPATLCRQQHQPLLGSQGLQDQRVLTGPILELTDPVPRPGIFHGIIG